MCAGDCVLEYQIGIPVTGEITNACDMHWVPTVGKLIVPDSIPFVSSQMTRWPVAMFSDTRSALPSLLKSPAPAMCHCVPIVGNVMLLANVWYCKRQSRAETDTAWRCYDHRLED
jgi:hypothetical protein